MITRKGNNSDAEAEEKNPKLCGTIYILLGISSLAFSVYTLVKSIGMVPLYGTVTAGVLIAGLAILLIIYGYRVLRKDY